MRRRFLLHNLTGFAWKVICQQFWLLAVLSMLFFILPLCAGPVAESLMSDGVDFSGITLAVCVPEGDDAGVLIEELTGKMRDISRYAQLISMEQEEAFAALDAGEVTAILLLPENFVSGVLYGKNSDVTVIVRDDQPMEAMLTLWVGSSAAELLSSAQKGIYTVLEIAEQYGTELSEDQIILQINLEYIRAALNRQDYFREIRLNPTGSMDILTHYGLSLVIFLVMALPPVFVCLFSQAYLPFRRRLLSIGCSVWKQLLSCWIVMFAILLVISAAPVWVLTGEFPVGIGILALFGCGYCSMCCLLSRSAAGCGCVSLAGAVGFLFVSGGILPEPLLPAAFRMLDVISPVGMLRDILYLPIDSWEYQILSLFVWIMLLFTGSWYLFKRRLTGEGAAV